MCGFGMFPAVECNLLRSPRLKLLNVVNLLHSLKVCRTQPVASCNSCMPTWLYCTLAMGDEGKPGCYDDMWQQMAIIMT